MRPPRPASSRSWRRSAAGRFSPSPPAAGLYLGLSLAPPGTGDSGLELVEASLIAGEAPSIAVVDLLELD